MNLYDSICDMKPSDIRRKNLANLVDKVGLTVFAKKAGKPVAQINDMLAGRKAFGEKVARQIEAAYAPSKPSGWLDIEEEMDILQSIIEDSENTKISGVNLVLDDKHCWLEKLNATAPPVFMNNDYIIDNGLYPDAMGAILMPDSSMETSLYNGDSLVINTEDKKQVDGLVYAFNYEGALLVRRLKRDAGEWWLCADSGNTRRYPDKRLHDGVLIIGRVIYRTSYTI